MRRWIFLLFLCGFSAVFAKDEPVQFLIETYFLKLPGAKECLVMADGKPIPAVAGVASHTVKNPFLPGWEWSVVETDCGPVLGRKEIRVASGFSVVIFKPPGIAIDPIVGPTVPSERNDADFIATPRITTIDGQEGTLVMGTRWAYMEKLPSGLFQLAKTPELDGIHVKARAARLEQDQKTIRVKLDISCRCMIGRETIEGVPPDLLVGKPRIETARHVSEFCVSDGAPVVLLLRVKGDKPGLLICALRISSIAPGEPMPPAWKLQKSKPVEDKKYTIGVGTKTTIEPKEKR